MRIGRGVLFGVAVGFCLVLVAAGQDAKTAPKAGEPAAPARAVAAGREYSGMYSFLSDGEFVQITVEDAGKVTGFVSRYGDKGEFVDQYFKTGKLDGNKIEFTTQTVQGVSFAFAGTVERGDGKNPGDEGYYLLKGALTENRGDAGKKESQVVLRMFPRNG
ncbi:MAG: hypothetical protein ACLQLC_05045 [Candidatus Sulfotelmatobacter sp.]